MNIFTENFKSKSNCDIRTERISIQSSTPSRLHMQITFFFWLFFLYLCHILVSVIEMVKIAKQIMPTENLGDLLYIALQYVLPVHSFHCQHCGQYTVEI